MLWFTMERVSAEGYDEMSSFILNSGGTVASLSIYQIISSNLLI